ncbi:mkkA, partial [Symbiodinium pilosum]
MSEANLQASQWMGTLSSPAAIQGTNMKWVRGESLGRGTLGNVVQALDQETGQLFAVKEVLINTSDAADVQFKHALENEIKICSALKHPSIVTYLGHDSIDGCLYIYMEYMIGGSMASVLHQFGAFEESLVSKYARDMLEGLAYLHTQEPPVLHRDIKSANVLMGYGPHGGELCAKLADFGCSKRNEVTLSHTMKGSIPWMAPEVVKNVGYGRMADMWSFGCVIIEMGTAQTPWGKFDNPMAAMYKIGMSDETPPLPASFSPSCRDFTQRCLQREPTQ